MTFVSLKERGPKSPKARGGGSGQDGIEDTDYQMSQFVPDLSVVGMSAGKS